MAQTLRSILVAVSLLAASITEAASDIPLESGSILRISDAEVSRVLPHAFYDQAMASLPQLYPKHVLLAARRSGRLGDVRYALVCYKETPASERVIIQAMAVHEGQAWSLEAIASVLYENTLIEVLEQIARLPSTAGAPRTPESGRR